MNHTIKALTLCFLAFSFFGYANEGSQHNLYENKLLISLPSELKSLSSKAINKRYGKQKVPPNYAFSTKDKSVSFTFTQYPTPADKSNMKKIHQSVSAMLRASEPDAKWKKDKVYTRLNTRVGVYEYETKGMGKYQYKITYLLPIDGKLTFISFTTTNIKYKSKWVAHARESFENIVLAES
ncbi:hypothetical protein tloyanaT_17520 [Thalassotalea loyana]|uniref:PsbP C-terminal domain-containing protein n=1 Tax=Thalassotalea loyana TaxID=280483 RepID=A0ABQ6HBJ9_9GAMM|nr:hypothetical protein [Thalassotalea loyana]GLX85500.1 hypothetical protein tloyanaT_17520 [Thalassotalea loyana]